MSSLDVCLVLDAQSKGWILEKFALRLQENLADFGVSAVIRSEPSPEAAINHWMIYHTCTGERPGPGTFFITHVDSIYRVQMVQRALQTADMGICMSRNTVEDLVKWGVPREKLCYISPAIDGLLEPRRVVIGLTTNLYDDGRKREDLLVYLSEHMDLGYFTFRIMGKGWEKMIPILEGAGARVEYFPGTEDFQNDYQQILKEISRFDYYLYMGLDEGSMGFLDALAAGVPTIVTPQGFHLDIPNGITHAFWDREELLAIFEKLSREVAERRESVAGLTWREYARKHALVWNMLLEGQGGVQIAQALENRQFTGVKLSRSPWKAFGAKVYFFIKPFHRLALRLRKKLTGK